MLNVLRRVILCHWCKVRLRAVSCRNSGVHHDVSLAQRPCEVDFDIYLHVCRYMVTIP